MLKIRTILMLFLLILAMGAVYGQMRHFEFINFDDAIYGEDNPHVISGPSLDAIGWAFSIDPSEKKGTYYHPLTWISHMLDCEFFGLNPGMHHMMNLFFHASNILLLFFVLWKMTDAFWKSFFVASLVALHPINVDSVAWIAERKSLLSTFFWMLTLLTYIFYVKKPGILRYLPILFFYICGLLSKPMVVTLPFALLLLDYWPLKRVHFDLDKDDKEASSALKIEKKSARFLILEKVPLFVLTGLSVFISWFSLQLGGETVSQGLVPLGLRLSNALVSYIIYFIKMIVPLNLAIFHPYPQHVPLWHVLCAFLVLITISALAFFIRKRYPFILVGWLWYLGTLVPVLGIIQGGRWPSYGERWAYIPFIGLFIIIAWGVPLILIKIKASRIFVVSIVLSVFVFLGALTWMQTGYWKNSLILFSHAVDVTQDNYLMHVNLGHEYGKRNSFSEEAEQYVQAIRINPDCVHAYNNLGNCYTKLGKYNEAENCLQHALNLQPDNAYTIFNFGNNYMGQNKPKEAIEMFKKAIEVQPDFYMAYNNLGNALFSIGKDDEAIMLYRQALELRPDYITAQNNLQKVLDKRKRLESPGQE